MTNPLSPAELKKLTGKTHRDAQAKELAHMGVPFTLRRDGSIVVLEAAVARLLGGEERTTIDPPWRPDMAVFDA